MGTVVRIRTAFVVAIAIAMTALLALLSPVTQIVVKLTATGFFMDGTGQPLAIPYNTPSYISTYIDRSYTKYVGPSGLCTGGNSGVCDKIAVYTPEQLWPYTGLFDMSFDRSRALGVQYLDGCLRGAACTVTMPPSYNSTGSQSFVDSVYTVLGYSQSSSISSLEKAALIANAIASQVGFVMLANPNRPNGGVLSRFAGLSIIGITFNGAAPTNSDPLNPLTTVDIARQYDGIADFPNNPLNLFAVLNALLGTAFLHSKYNTAAETPQLQGVFQDTTYYMIPTETVPLVMPLKWIPIVGDLLATALDPFARVLVEAGYDRTMNPGQPAVANLFYFHPLRTILNLIAAIPVAIDNVMSYLAGWDYRPLGTVKPGPYGVGGPPVFVGNVDPYGPPTPALMAAPAPTLFAAPLSGSADVTPTPLAAARSMALFSVEPDPLSTTESTVTTTEPTPSVTTDPTPTATVAPTPSATTDPTPSASSSPTPSATTEPTTSSTSGSTSSTSTSSTGTTSTGSTSTSSTGTTSTGSTSTSSTGTTSTGSTSTSSTGTTSTGSTSTSSTGTTSTHTGTTSSSTTSGSTTSGTSSGSTSSGSTSSGSTSGTSSGSTSSGSTSSGSTSSGSTSSGGSSSSGAA